MKFLTQEKSEEEKQLNQGMQSKTLWRESQTRVSLYIQMCVEVDRSHYKTLSDSSNVENGRYSEFEMKETTG